MDLLRPRKRGTRSNNKEGEKGQGVEQPQPPSLLWGKLTLPQHSWKKPGRPSRPLGAFHGWKARMKGRGRIQAEGSPAPSMEDAEPRPMTQ